MACSGFNPVSHSPEVKVHQEKGWFVLVPQVSISPVNSISIKYGKYIIYPGSTLAGQMQLVSNPVSHSPDVRYIKKRVEAIQACNSPMNSICITFNLDSFCVSYIHRAIPFLPNPGYHPRGDEAVSSTSRWWCLQQYTYSRRISLWNIQHDKCLCRFFNRWHVVLE